MFFIAEDNTQNDPRTISAPTQEQGEVKIAVGIFLATPFVTMGLILGLFQTAKLV